MTDFIARLENTLEKLKTSMIKAGEETIKLTGEAATEAISGIGTAVEDAAKATKDIATEAGEKFLELVKLAYADIMTLRTNFIQILHTLEAALKKGVGAASEVTNKIENGAQEFVSDIQTTVQHIDEVLGKIKTAAETAIQNAAADIKRTATALLNEASSIAETIGHTASGMIQTARNTLSTVVSDIKSLLQTTINTFISAVRTITDGVKTAASDAVTAIDKIVSEASAAGVTIANDVASAADDAVGVVRAAASDVYAAGDDIVGNISKLPTSGALVALFLPTIGVAILAAMIMVAIFYVGLKKTLALR